MSQQNINQYVYRKWKVKPKNGFFDLSLASDERDYNQEVVFSNSLIALNDGNRMPIHFDLNNSGSSQMITMEYGDFFSANTLISLNYYNPNNEDLTCFSSQTLCDIGLTGIDNGLTSNFSGETLYYTMGLYTGQTKWDRLHFDRRFKFVQITANTTTTITVTLESLVEPGSVISIYNLYSDQILVEDLTVNFTNTLGLLNGGVINITTGVTISQGQSSGTTTITTNEDFNNLNRTSVISGVTFDSNQGFYLPQVTPEIIFASQTPTPSVTPTITPSTTINPTPTTSTQTPTTTGTLTSTPTSSITSTPTTTPTTTLTPSVTETSTQTPTPSITSTITPTPSVTETSSPTPTPSMTQTSTPSVTQTLTPSSSPIIEPSPTPSPTMDTPPPVNNFSWSFVDQTRSGLNSYVIVHEGNTVVNVTSDDSGSFEVADKDVVGIILNFTDGDTATSRLNEDGNIIYVDSQNRVPSVIDSGNITITGGAIYIADGFITVP